MTNTDFAAPAPPNRVDLGGAHTQDAHSCFAIEAPSPVSALAGNMHTFNVKSPKAKVSFQVKPQQLEMNCDSFFLPEDEKRNDQSLFGKRSAQFTETPPADQRRIRKCLSFSPSPSPAQTAQSAVFESPCIAYHSHENSGSVSISESDGRRIDFDKENVNPSPKTCGDEPVRMDRLRSRSDFAHFSSAELDEEEGARISRTNSAPLQPDASEREPPTPPRDHLLEAGNVDGCEMTPGSRSLSRSRSVGSPFVRSGPRATPEPCAGSHVSGGKMEVDSPTCRKGHEGTPSMANVTEESIGAIPLKLPTSQGEHPDLACLDPTTMVNILKGTHDRKFGKIFLLDCRYPYEYEGGHIKGAVNIWDPHEVEKIFLECEKENIALILHCEFSSHRAPRLCRHIRNVDRRTNLHLYPKLYYPDLYCLTGGYKRFFAEYPEWCEPNTYTQMRDERFTSEFKNSQQALRKAWSSVKKG